VNEYRVEQKYKEPEFTTYQLRQSQRKTLEVNHEYCLKYLKLPTSIFRDQRKYSEQIETTFDELAKGGVEDD
jgi:hypothetical protein